MKASALLEAFSDISISFTTRSALTTGSFRLDASYYNASAVSSQALLLSSGLKMDLCGQVADIYCSSLRERTFVSSKYGIALLGGHNLNTEDDQDLKYVSKLLTPQLETESLQTGDVLLSSAGTIGLFDFVCCSHEGRMASQHIIRVRAHPEKIRAGYLYAYLSSPLALSMVTNQSAGSVIVTLYTEHLADFPIPRLTVVAESCINDLILQSFALRRDSRELQYESRDLALKANELPCLAEQDEDRGDSFSLPTRVITTAPELRLEANFHNPVARRAIEGLRETPAAKSSVHELTKRVFLCDRFARTYVDKENGIPFLSGKNIIQIRPSALKYVSSTETAGIENLKLQRSWILVSRSGTVGRLCFVHRNFEEYTGTDDIIRIVADTNKIDPGYLYAFLSSSYGYEQILRFRHGSVIDHITPEQVQKVIVPLPHKTQQRQIGDKVRLAYEKRADALKLEDQAQEILLREIKGKPSPKS